MKKLEACVWHDGTIEVYVYVDNTKINRFFGPEQQDKERHEIAADLVRAKKEIEAQTGLELFWEPEMKEFIDELLTI